MSEQIKNGEAPLRMDAYYYGFDPTGVREIDLVLSAIACAGKAYHHTECWNDQCEWPPHTGKSPVEWIQNAANAAATAMLAAAPAPPARVSIKDRQGFKAGPLEPAGDAGQQSPEDRIEALFRNRMTPYGMLVRALRIVAGSTLMNMAERLGKTPAELSAVEMGRKPATPELASLTAKFFADKGIYGTQPALMVAVEASKGEKG
ncbi:helix-turn-helix domain-containing protein [Cupriavidus gilardii]|uniref:helix-turn-helix domain-containing protein n=1 Tax=Cupriavidus gilardii TaxID=82541 RepID=UPI0015806AF6|nr:helix-turn-helix transcriptional regulator [Cupriavidus gilardii]QKS60879.1 helix-turn-helix transcriptional regulator [Cupriavidus gilardii]